jgi:hypothetical protein
MRERYLRHEIVVITAVSSVIYVAVGMYVRVLLNWIVGPLWPIACVWFVPPLVRRAFRWDDPRLDDPRPDQATPS